MPWLLLIAFLAPGWARAAEIIWRMENLERIGGHPVMVVGAPRVDVVAGVGAVVFDGKKDGLFLPAIPFAGARSYTIEILFCPASDGPAEQRFWHAQDANESRVLIETMLDGKCGWWLDTFITNRTPGSGVTLIEPKNVHRADRWYWAALRYDGKTMAHFVNGRKELERDATFAALGEGQISLGVRQNKVHWFKGAIREVRYHTLAVADEKLQRWP